MLSLGKYSIKMNQRLRVSEYLENIVKIFSKYLYLMCFVLSVNCFDKEGRLSVTSLTENITHCFIFPILKFLYNMNNI